MENFTFAGPFGALECIVEKNRGSSNAVLVMAHGFRGSRDGGGRAAEVAYRAAAYADVVRFNFTGTQIITCQVEEIKSVLRKIRLLLPDCKLFLLGRSLGGAASVITASQEQNLSGLILWAAPNDLRATFRHVMAVDDYERLDRGETLFFCDERGECILTPDFLKDFDKYNLSKCLCSIKKLPVLILHCQDDEIVLAEQAERNAEILQEKGTLHIFPHGDHSFTQYSEMAASIIADWLRIQL